MQHSERKPVVGVASGVAAVVALLLAFPGRAAPAGSGAVAISPTSVCASVPSGTTRIVPLRIENVGTADVAYSLSFGVTAIAPCEGGTGARGGTDPARSAVPPFGVLLLHSGIGVSEILSRLAGFDRITYSAALDAESRTPSLAELRPFRAVIVVVNRPFADPERMGDLLADYLAEGGGVVLTLASMLEGWDVRGRFAAQGSNPFLLGTRSTGPGSLGATSAAHPILTGVSALEGRLRGDPRLAPGAKLVAAWDDAVPLVATYEDRVAAANLFVGGEGYWRGDAPRLLGNAALWVARLSPWAYTASSGGVVPAGGAVAVPLVLDATDLDQGEHRGALIVTTAGPDGAELVVPIGMRVTGVPRLVLEGTERVAESVVDFTGDGAATRHEIPLSVAPAAGGSIELDARGDFDGANETAAATAEGIVLGIAGRSGRVCATASSAFPLAPEPFGALAADGVVRVDVRNSPDVNSFCGVNRHVVRVRYGPAVERLDFGVVFAGSSRARSLTLRNLGTAPLAISSVRCDGGDFRVSVDSLSIPPRASRSIEVTFAPTELGDREGALLLDSDDPATPSLALPLAGSALKGPELQCEPPAIAGTVRQGRSELRIVTIANEGGSPLDFSAALRGPPESGSVSDGCPVSAVVVAESSGGALRSFDLASGVSTGVAEELVTPFGIAVSGADRTAYVTEFYEGRLLAVGLDDGGTRIVATGLDRPTGVVLDPKGHAAWVTEWRAGRVSSVDLETGARATVVDRLDGPTHLAVGPGRLLYVAEGGAGRLSAVDSDSGVATVVASGLRAPRGVAIDATLGTAYVTERVAGAIVAVDLPTGAVRTVATGLTSPFGLALDLPGGRLLVAEETAGRVSALDLRSGAVTPAAVGLEGPVALAAAPSRVCTAGITSLVPSAGTVPPGGAARLELRLDGAWLPPGKIDGEIVVTSNAPVAPVRVVPASLTVLPAPVLDAPSEPIVARLASGGVRTEASPLCNRGAEALDFAASVAGGFESVPAPRWLRVAPALGSIPPGRCVELIATIDAQRLVPAEYEASIVVRGHAPDDAGAVVAVTLEVVLPGRRAPGLTSRSSAPARPVDRPTVPPLRQSPRAPGSSAETPP